MKTYCQVLISATTKEEANTISDALIKAKLVSGCLITHGPSRYWWEGSIVEQEYYNISAFSLFKNKTQIISEINKYHSDKCPIIAFFAIDGNQEFLDWIKNIVI
jgi:periplasmic divalent cation tolerance protein